MTRTSPKPARFKSSRLARTFVILALPAISILLCTNACSLGGLDEPEPDAWIEIKGQRISIEIADTPEKQQKGLGERDSLAWDHGMYFEYAQPAFYAFWMKGMRFPIDIIWLRDGRIVGFELNIPFEEGGNGPTVRPRELVDAVLEVPAGYAAASGWRIGDRVQLERVKAN
jgi:uncharacterized membrane protein (UPF0127 family)